MTTTEAKWNDLARAINEALTARGNSGYAYGRFVYNQSTPEATVRAERDEASAKASDTVHAMWRLFYELASDIREELADADARGDAEFKAGVQLLNGEKLS